MLLHDYRNLKWIEYKLHQGRKNHNLLNIIMQIKILREKDLMHSLKFHISLN